LLGALLLVLGAIALLGSAGSTATTDFGFAVLVRGGVLADAGDGVPNLVGNLDTIPAGAALTAQTDAVLGLQSTYEGSTELTRGNVYLAQGAAIQLSAIDPRRDDGEPGSTRLALDQGSILISRQSGTWEYRVQFEANESILSGAGPAAMGVVSNNGGGHHLFCLIGICRFESATREDILLNSGEKILLIASSGTIEQSRIEPAVVAQWNRMCADCLQGVQ
ncbi:MAG: hypothetical protein ACE5M4_13785, partial [Anaerolineales bacterium]